MRGNRMETARSPRFARDDVVYRWIRIIIWSRLQKKQGKKRSVEQVAGDEMPLLPLDQGGNDLPADTHGPAAAGVKGAAGGRVDRARDIAPGYEAPGPAARFGNGDG